MTYSEFVQLARRFHRKTLATKTGKTFRVDVEGSIVYFTPDSTGLRRSISRAVTDELLDRYRRTHSLRPVDYVELTRNASYFTALLSQA